MAAELEAGKPQHSDVSQKFSDIFRRNLWASKESVSGPGSTKAATDLLVPQLLDLFERLKISLFVDAPCGDTNWIEPVLSKVDVYAGFDIVPDLVQKLEAEGRFGAKAQFALADLTADQLPKADLILCRDCLVHLSDDLVFQALSRLRASRSRWLLTTTFPDVENRRGTTGGWRPINLTKAPFNLPEPLELIVERPNLAPNPAFGRKALGLWDLQALKTLLPVAPPPPAVLMLRAPASGAMADLGLRPVFEPSPQAAQAPEAPPATPPGETMVWTSPNTWAVSTPLFLPGESDLYVLLEADCETPHRTEVQILRRNAAGDQVRFAWFPLFQGELSKLHKIVPLSWLGAVNGFEPSEGDQLILRVKSVDGGSHPVRLFMELQADSTEPAPDATGGGAEPRSATPPAPRPKAATRTWITRAELARAQAGRRATVSEWGEVFPRISRRTFFAGESCAFEVELIRLEGAPFKPSDLEGAVLRVQGWSSQGTDLEFALSFVSSDIIRGTARVGAFDVGGALRGVHAGEDHRSQTFDLSIALRDRTVFCGQILVAAMERPEKLVLNAGCRDDLSPECVGLDIRPFRKDGLESVMWDFSSGLGFADDGAIDGVTVSHALSSLNSVVARRFMREAYRALKTGGVLRITEDDARRSTGDDATCARLYTDPREVALLLEEAGFQARPMGPDDTLADSPLLARKLHMQAWNDSDWRAGKAGKIFFVEGVKPVRHYNIATTRIRDPVKGLSPENIIDHSQYTLLPNTDFYLIENLYCSFAADPFLLRWGGRYFLFFEARTNPATIAVSESEDGLHWGPAQFCIRAATHRSFPFVFEDAGEVFMIPESAADNSVILYRATAMPTAWEPARTLLSGKPYGDTTLVRKDDVYYIFTFEAGKLSLFYTSDLLSGEIIEHPANPIASGTRYARSGGRIFEHGGSLYRPAQDRERYYGEKVHLLEILTLTPNDYEERVYADDFITGPLSEDRNTWDAKIHHYDVLKLAEGEWLCTFDGTGILR